MNIQRKWPLYAMATLLVLSSCAGTHSITERPIPFEDTRTELSLAYMREHYGLDPETPEIVPRMIVLHHTVIPTWEKTYEAFEPEILPSAREGIRQAGNLNVSSQFVVDRDGTIYRLMPETRMARHVIGLNHCAIGVENVGGTEDLPLTRAQVRSNIWLVNYLAEKYPIEYLIGHYEYTRFEGHPLWLEQDEGYRTVKTDPSKEFMEKVRKAVKNLNFKPVP